MTDAPLTRRDRMAPGLMRWGLCAVVLGMVLFLTGAWLEDTDAADPLAMLGTAGMLLGIVAAGVGWVLYTGSAVMVEDGVLLDPVIDPRTAQPRVRAALERRRRRGRQVRALAVVLLLVACGCWLADQLLALGDAGSHLRLTGIFCLLWALIAGTYAVLHLLLPLQPREQSR